MKNYLKVMSAFLVILLSFSLAGCGTKEASTANNTSDTTDSGLFTIRVATQTSFNETQIAEDLGYFKEQGIRIEYTGVIKAPMTEYQLIAQGINDAFIGGHPNNVAQARLAGIKVLVTAPGMIDNEKFPHVRYLVRNDSTIKSLNDINGKKVAISSLGVCTNGYLQYYLLQNKLPDEVKWVTLPNAGQMEQSLSQGLIDVSTSHPPYAGIAVKQGGVRQIASSWDILHDPSAGLSVRGFSDDFIKENPEIVKGFNAALAKVHPWINAHQEEAKVIIGKRLNLKPEDLSVFWYDEEKSINPAYIETWFNLSEKLGLWKHGEIKPTDIFTNAYAPQ
ncbi:MAG: ABC transporter substrate-binding protein [Ruminiclostridium sp.]